MKIKPILFNTEMVRAILDGRKTVTRRVIKPRYREDESGFHVNTDIKGNVTGVEKTNENGGALFGDYGDIRSVNPPYHPGDILYVRETWRKNNGKYYYKANEYPDYDDYFTKKLPCSPKWHPSIHMPKEAARIWLKVTDVRAERLQNITEKQAEKEGAKGLYITQGARYGVIRTAIDDFIKIWDSTIKKKDLPLYGWNANPWVWVIEFERCEKP